MDFIHAPAELFGVRHGGITSITTPAWRPPSRAISPLSSKQKQHIARGLRKSVSGLNCVTILWVPTRVPRQQFTRFRLGHVFAMETPTSPSQAVQALSTVDCYTCRRRRVRCDRVLPGCAKCARTQLDCLGYKKPLVWNKGVASRGKMMGKTFPVPTPPKSQSQLQSHFGREKISKSRRIVRYDPAQRAVVGDIAGTSPIEAGNSEEEEDVYRGGVEGETWSEREMSPYASSNGDSSPDLSSESMVLSNNIKYSLSFIKPSFLVDLDTTDRYYLDYCGFVRFLACYPTCGRCFALYET